MGKTAKEALQFCVDTLGTGTTLSVGMTEAMLEAIQQHFDSGKGYNDPINF